MGGWATLHVVGPDVVSLSHFELRWSELVNFRMFGHELLGDAAGGVVFSITPEAR